MSKKTKQTKTKRGKTQSQKQKQSQIINIKIGDTNKSKARKQQQRKPPIIQDKQPDTTKQQPSVNIVNQLPSYQPSYQPPQITRSIESQKVGENVTNDLLRTLINLQQSRPLSNSIKTYDDYNYDNISEISDYKNNMSQFSQPNFFNDNISELSEPTFFNIPSQFTQNKIPSIISSIKSNNSFYSENLNDINRDDNIDILEKTNVSNIFYDDNNIAAPFQIPPPPPGPPPPKKSPAQEEPKIIPGPPPPPEPLNLLDQIKNAELKKKNKQVELPPPPPEPLNLLDQIKNVELKKKNEQVKLAPPPPQPINILNQIKKVVNLNKVKIVQVKKEEPSQKTELEKRLDIIAKAKRGSDDESIASGWSSVNSVPKQNLKDINRDDKIDTAEKTNIFVPENIEDIILINKQIPQPQENILEEIMTGKKIEDITPPSPQEEPKPKYDKNNPPPPKKSKNKPPPPPGPPPPKKSKNKPPPSPAQ